MKKYLIIFLIQFLLFTSCKEKIDLVPIEDSDVESLNNYSEKQSIDTLDPLIAPMAGKGSIWKQWEKIYKECMQSQGSKNPYYLGVSNSFGLGKIIDKGNNNTLKIFEKIVGKKILDSLTEDATESDNCSIATTSDFSLNILLGGNLHNIDSDLKLALERSDSTFITGGKWKRKKLIVKDFLSYIQNSTDPNVKEFYNVLTDKKSRIIVESYEVEGFKAGVVLNSGLTTELQAKLDSGLVANVSNGNFGFNFKKANSKTILAESNAKFIVFGKLYRVKK